MEYCSNALSWIVDTLAQGSTFKPPRPPPTLKDEFASSPNSAWFILGDAFTCSGPVKDKDEVLLLKLLPVPPTLQSCCFARHVHHWTQIISVCCELKKSQTIATNKAEISSVQLTLFKCQSQVYVFMIWHDIFYVFYLPVQFHFISNHYFNLKSHWGCPHCQ